MAINPMIPLYVRPAQIETPVEVDRRLAAVAQQHQQLAQGEQQQQLNAQRMTMNESSMRLSGLQEQEYQAKLADTAARREEAAKVQEILGRHGGDLEKALPEISAISPLAGAAFQKDLDARKKTALEQQTKQADLEIKRAGMLGDGLANVLAETDPKRRNAAYTAQRAALLGTGLFTAEQIPEVMPDEATLKALASQVALARQAQEARATAADARAEAADTRAAGADARSQEVHDATLPGKTVDTKTGLTPPQSEQKRHNMAMEAKGGASGASGDDGKQARSAIAKLDTEARALQGRIDSRESAKAPLRKKKSQLESEIAFLEEQKPKNWKESVAKKRSEWQGNESQLRDIEAQQADLVSRKQDLYGQIRGIKGTPPAAAAAKPAAQSLDEATLRARAKARGMTPAAIDAVVAKARAEGVLK